MTRDYPTHECPIATEEFLLYDFSVQVGDTLKLCWFNPQNTDVIPDIPSLSVVSYSGYVYYNNYGIQDELRKRIDIAVVNGWFSGVGGPAGLLPSKVNPYMLTVNVYIGAFWNDPDFDCATVYTGITEELLLSRRVSFYPNPVKDKGIIVCKTLSDALEYTLVSAYGQVVTQGIIQKEQTEIDLESLAQGVYILTVTDTKTNHCVHQKIVKE